MEEMMPEPYDNKVTYKARLPTAQEIDLFVRDTPEWSKFTDSMEFTYHSVAHLFVGGNKEGTMNRPFSPMDWTFFLHHGYVDYIWSRWQELHPGSHDFGSKPLPGYGSLTGASVANREELCYQYLPPGALNPKPVPPRPPPPPPRPPTPRRLPPRRLPRRLFPPRPPPLRLVPRPPLPRPRPLVPCPRRPPPLRRPP
ncbi:hypothetical protein BCR44DRAFT_1084439 [Catenaria anguillulae PL171]|uniref:Tyrosinase copper-binding domain-containing protein n=1 Tax=Catenaria anguillulae PL171 TaxID=765915 RepID=A0A1Y2HQW6_9FUNG|nr:hypothetical protein BCR44DRAFT_1084439 [Catenaria anguillulae PL171]